MLEKSVRSLEVACLAMASFVGTAGCINNSLGAKPEAISPASGFSQKTDTTIGAVFQDPGRYVGSSVTLTPHQRIGYASFIEFVEERQNKDTNALEYFHRFHSQYGVVSHDSLTVVADKRLGMHEAVTGVLNEVDGKYFVDARQ